MNLQEWSGVVVDNLLDRCDLFSIRESFEKSQLRLDQLNKPVRLGILQLSEKLFCRDLVSFVNTEIRHLRIT